MQIPIAPIDRIIRDAGARRVSEEAAKELAKELERYALEIAARAVKYATHAKRRTVTKEDIQLAIRG